MINTYPLSEVQPCPACESVNTGSQESLSGKQWVRICRDCGYERCPRCGGSFSPEYRTIVDYGPLRLKDTDVYMEKACGECGLKTGRPVVER